jgi:uncharacterized protein YeaO (DUF488 family)
MKIRENYFKEKRKMIKTKSIYYDPVDVSDGIRILVTRYYPRGITKNKYDLWIKEVSPSKKLLKDYKNKSINELEYKQRYISEMEIDKGHLNSLKLRHGAGNIITLLCIEREGEFCHRHILKKLIEKDNL